MCDVHKLLMKLNQEFRSLSSIKLDYNPFLGFGYEIEYKGLKFFMTKNKSDKQMTMEIHTIQSDDTIQTVQVPQEALHLGLRLIDKIEKPVVQNVVSIRE